MMIEEIDFTQNIEKQTLMDALKTEAATVHVNDIMAAINHVKTGSIYVQENYREIYDEIYIKSFLLRIREIRNNKNSYNELINVENLQEAIKILKIQEKLVEPDNNSDLHFFKIYRLITLYTTFIMDEPVHPVGMPFPGGFKIKQEDGIYYCPVKESQKDNPGAVCGICIAEQDQDV